MCSINYVFQHHFEKKSLLKEEMFPLFLPWIKQKTRREALKNCLFRNDSKIRGGSVFLNLWNFGCHCFWPVVIVCLVMACVTVFLSFELRPVEQRSVSGTWWTEEGSGFGIKPHDLAAPSPWSKCHLLAENLFRPPPPSTSVWATY